MILYQELSEVCRIFCQLYFPHHQIAQSIHHQLQKFNCKKILFIGALHHTAKLLKANGYDITFVDYTEEMINEAKKVLTDTEANRFVVADIRNLSLLKNFDAAILMGRILTYMYSDEDVIRAFSALRSCLKTNGVIILDNYESGKIENTNYFNGVLDLKGIDSEREFSPVELTRTSKITRQGNVPTLYKWDSTYEINYYDQNTKKSFRDNNHIIRSFAKDELKDLIVRSKLMFLDHLSNFEDISFISIAKKT